MMYAKLPNLVIGFHGCNREAYENVIYRNQSLKASCNLNGLALPVNRESKKTKDILLRDLDCAVILQVQDLYSTDGKPAFDSVRGVFIEGNAPYPGAAFCEKTHIQLCICNPNCIKGYFSPRVIDKKYSMP